MPWLEHAKSDRSRRRNIDEACSPGLAYESLPARLPRNFRQQHDACGASDALKGVILRKAYRVAVAVLATSTFLGPGIQPAQAGTKATAGSAVVDHRPGKRNLP